MNQMVPGQEQAKISDQFLDGIRSVKVSWKKVNVTLDKEMRGR
jgi:hypothetical protein